MIRAALLVLVFFALALPTPLGAESLWSEDSYSLYSNRKASRIGDVVTVIIAEKSSGYNRSKSNSKKEDTHELSGAGGGALDFIPLFGWDYESSVEFKGNASTQVAGGLTARISAQVVDILPNGHMVISGSRNLKVNGETEMITVFGEVRPEDVLANNTVFSSSIANAAIEYKGSGPATQSTKRGILHRIFSWLF